MASELPIPPRQFFYADSFYNPQIKPIAALIEHVHYPTLGCPSLLGPGQQLQVLLSLPAGADAAGVAFHLADRHLQNGKVFKLSGHGDPEWLADGPGGQRKLYRCWLGMDGVPFALFDLHVAFDGQKEVQYNAVRRYQAITGKEQVIFCGDSQYNGDNLVCLKRFIEHVNEKQPDVAWIALIGDICDNGVKGWKNLVKLAIEANGGAVIHYYGQEYQQSHELLRNLRHPVVIVPGNHDGMSAYPNYQAGQTSDVFTGPDPANQTEYDGLQHFRRAFGPLSFRFDWANTRYLCTNTFELTRRQRLGYHAIVANWGGWMRPEQLNWVKSELASAAGMHKVMLMHHDPRGGSEGQRLGHFHRMRPYNLDNKLSILTSYLSYILRHGRKGFQQEWMAPEDGDDVNHPVKGLLQAMLGQEVWAVVMGHDNENWVDSYYQGYDLFQTEPSTTTYMVRGDVGDDQLVDDVLDCLKNNNYEALSNLIEEKGKGKVEMALSAALDEMKRELEPVELVFAAPPAADWGLEVKKAIHFVHVDDIGAYKYEESDFDDYGYVVADLEGGKPVRVQSHRLSGRIGQAHRLDED